MNRGRRGTLLAVGGVLGVAVAGCTDTDEGEEATPTADATSEQASGDATRSDPGHGDLDLREANVTALEVESVNGANRFSVTLLHDNEGEDGYANWWQVEDVGGERFGRRDLAHTHDPAGVRAARRFAGRLPLLTTNVYISRVHTSANCTNPNH